MSVVLVVIGFLAGGVLAGSELIHAAKVRKQGKQFEEYTALYHTFRLKYNCLPGDCRNGSQFFSGAVNGNGNERIENNAFTNYDNAAVNWPASNEYQYFFVMLGQAGMVGANYTASPAAPLIGHNMPALALNSAAGFFVADAQSFDATRNPPIQNYRRGNTWIWAVVCDVSSPLTQDFDDDCGVFAADDLRRIDDKLDDGLPLSGKLLGFGGYNTQNACLVGTTSYELTHTDRQCQAAYQID